jgi:hypothetical protein
MLQLNRDIPFVESVFRLIERTGSQDAAVTIFEEAEQTHNIRIISSIESTFPEIPDSLYDNITEKHLYPFLSSTQLILPVPWYDQITIVIQEEYQYTATWRGYSEVLADWATTSAWLGIQKWDYTDFYLGNIYNNIEHYASWAETAMSIIKARNSVT